MIFTRLQKYWQDRSAPASILDRQPRILEGAGDESHKNEAARQRCGRNAGADYMVRKFLGRVAWPVFLFFTWLTCGPIITPAATHNL